MKFAKIEIHLSLFLLIAVCAFTGFLWEAFIITIVFLAHELGHLIWLTIFKAKLVRIQISMIGGLIEVIEEPRPFWQDVLIDSGGISVNIILNLILTKQVDNYPVLLMAFNYNKLMLFFNLLPIYPLDGYRILNHFLGIFYEEEYRSELLFYLSLLIVIIISVWAFIIKSFGLAIVLLFFYQNLYKLLIEGKRSRIAHLKNFYFYHK